MEAAGLIVLLDGLLGDRLIGGDGLVHQADIDRPGIHVGVNVEGIIILPLRGLIVLIQLADWTEAEGLCLLPGLAGHLPQLPRLVEIGLRGTLLQLHASLVKSGNLSGEVSKGADRDDVDGVGDHEGGVVLLLRIFGLVTIA